jgi:hypothetical protein
LYCLTRWIKNLPFTSENKGLQMKFKSVYNAKMR